jgi:hypothetical protein
MPRVVVHYSKGATIGAACIPWEIKLDRRSSRSGSFEVVTPKWINSNGLII